MGKRFRLHALDTPAGLIGQITARSYNPGIVPATLRGDGRQTPHFAGVMTQHQSMTVTTEGIKTALDAIGLGFYSFSDDVTAYFAQTANGGGLAGSGHASLSGALGCIVPVELSAQHGGNAQLQFELYWLSSDGIVVPATYTGTGVALPSLSVSEAFTLGLASINGSALTEIQSFRMRFNYGTKVESSSGNVYPTMAYFDTFEPEITVTLKDPSQIHALGLGGVAQGATASKFYFRKKTAGGGNVANATASHIKLTVAAGFHRPDPMNETDGDASTADLVSHPIDDGTNSVVAINTASAIS